MSTATERPDPDAAPIFVVGSGRSGTTLLRMMLNAHPRIYLTHEASFYLVPSHQAEKASSEQWLDWYFRSFNFAWLGLATTEVRAELPSGDLPHERLPDVYRAVMRAKARQYGRPRYGDKTPWHAVRLDRIFADFPHARVIHIVREPCAAVASLMRQPWGSSSHMIASWFCKKQVEGTRELADKIHEVRLEDLLADPRRAMEKILAYVGEPWDERVLDHSAHAPTDDVPPMPWYLPATEKRGGVRRAGGSALSPAWTRFVERDHAWTMERFGYEPAALEREPSAAERMRAFVADLPEAVAFGWRFVPGILRVTRKSGHDAADAQRFFFNLNPKAWAHFPGVVIPDPPDPAAVAPSSAREQVGTAGR